MAAAWSTPIEKLMIWRSNTWMKYDNLGENLTLHLHCDQLIISSDIKVLESLNIMSKIKGLYKHDVLILFISLSGKQIKKIKFQIKTNVAHCLRTLGDRFPVMSYDKSNSKIPSKYKNLDEVLQNFLVKLNDTSDGSMNSLAPPLPKDYGSFIKLCIMDPSFPDVIKETEKAFTSIFNKKV